MKYNQLEDKAIQILRKHVADEYRRPKWGQIVNLMNSHRGALNAAKESEEYTISMVRNRYQRMTRLTHVKPKRNVCSKCGLLLRGHTCLGDCKEDAAADVVYDLLGISKPTTEQDEDEELPLDSNDDSNLLSDTNDGCEFVLDTAINEEELPGLFELFQRYDEHPDSIEHYKAVWDNM